MENNNILTDKIIDMKFDKYGYEEEKNFASNGELTVTITLHEYRHLLQREAKSEADEMRSKYWKLDSECKDLKKEVEHLKAVIETLQGGNRVNEEKDEDK